MVTSAYLFFKPLIPKDNLAFIALPFYSTFLFCIEFIGVTLMNKITCFRYTDHSQFSRLRVFWEPMAEYAHWLALLGESAVASDWRWR